MILSRSHVYRLDELLDEEVLRDVFLGTGEVLLERVSEVQSWSLNMHKSILPCDRDFYERLGWLMLFLVSDAELQSELFSLRDPQVIYWSKCSFLDVGCAVSQ